MTSAALFPDARERPVAAGMAWAAMTFVLMIVFGLLFGHPVTLRQMVVLALLMPFGGLIWGYYMHWVLEWLSPTTPEGR